jgi:ribonuclease BN (tRNA processing enzyme)
LRAWLLGSGGWIPNGRRETTCVLVRDGASALVLDAGTGLRRLITQPELLEGVERIDIALTHFHLDHVCGLAYTSALPVTPIIWAPGEWLYETPSTQLLAPLRTAPISPFDASEPVHELRAGEQRIGPFKVTARAQSRHWAPTAGLRIGDALALITDTAFDPGSIELADGVGHLLHEAWSIAGDAGDASASEAARVARESGAERLTLVHLHPLADEPALLAAAPGAALGEDGVELGL